MMSIVIMSITSIIESYFWLWKGLKHMYVFYNQMGKIVSNVLTVVLVLSIGIILGSAYSTSSLLGAAPSTGKTSSNSSMKSGNSTSSSSMTNKTGAGNMSKAGNATAGNMSKAAANMSKAAGNVSKVGGGVLANLSKAVGGGLKGLGNLISPGKHP